MGKNKSKKTAADLKSAVVGDHNLNDLHFDMKDKKNGEELEKRELKKVRERERNIGNIVDLVGKWRSLYRGVKINEHGETEQTTPYSLEGGA